MRWTSLGLALAVGFAPSYAVAKDPAPQPLRASLEVNAGATEDGAELEERVNTALGARLRRAEVLPRKSLEDGLIHVELTPLPGGDGYHYDVYAKQADRTLAATKTEADCAGCDEAALLEAVGEAVDKCLPPLAATVAQPVQPEEPPPPVVDVKPAQDPDSDGRSRTGPLGKTGIGLMVAGAATAVVGVIFVVQGRTFDTRPGALEQEGVDFRPPGFAMLAGGAAMLITGGALYGVDRRRHRTGAAVAWIPGGAVASVGGRF